MGGSGQMHQTPRSHLYLIEINLEKKGGGDGGAQEADRTVGAGVGCQGGAHPGLGWRVGHVQGDYWGVWGAEGLGEGEGGAAAGAVQAVGGAVREEAAGEGGGGRAGHGAAEKDVWGRGELVFVALWVK